MNEYFLDEYLKSLEVKKNKWHKLELYFKVTDDDLFIDDRKITIEEENESNSNS